MKTSFVHGTAVEGENFDLYAKTLRTGKRKRPD